jgi:hypothetical protein
MGTLSMIPDNSLSSTFLPAPYIPPDNRVNTKLLDYELGGVGLNDATEGLEVQVWTLTLVIDEISTVGTVYITSENGESLEAFTGIGITEGSLAFDQNMNPFVAFMQAGEAKYWWFDTTDSSRKTTTLPAGTEAPKCTLDDKRPTQTSTSDIIMCYTRTGNLYFRAQRDRYTVEYLLASDVTGQVLKVGMNEKLRLQIAVGEFE